MGEGDVDERLTELVDAAAAYRDAVTAVDAVGDADVVADAYDRATRLLDRYERSATGTGDFQSYIEFRDEFIAYVEGLPEELSRREAFEAADERVDKRRLSASDFDAARRALAPAREVVDTLDDRAAARERYREARRAVVEARDARDDRIDYLEHLLDLGAADLDGPVDELRDPIEAYDRAVRDAFESFKGGASAVSVLSFVADTAAYPLVDFPQPPAHLLDYVRSHEAGDEPIPKLLEYAGYSRSKLSHYVGEVDALKRAVATNQTYLERLSADPLTVGWPPPPAGRLRWRARELVSVVDCFADESVVAHLHDLRDVARQERYGPLRESAVARYELTDEERARLVEGSVEPELERLRAERARLAAALDEVTVE